MLGNHLRARYPPAMEGVTTAIVAFVLACLIFPHVIKNKPQYYGAVACVLLIILFGALRAMTGPGFAAVAFVFISLLQVGAIFLLILSAGGLTVKDLAGELAETIEVVRRGGDKEIIVPLRGEQPGAGRAQREAMRENERQGSGRINLDVPPSPPPAPSTPPDREDDERGGIPLA
jgi:hypothetical protein